jgi:nucleoside-diphosphate-sugar epimerase
MINALENAKVLVTGGAGFIGSHLVQQLLKIGAKVTILDHTNAVQVPKNVGGDLKLTARDIRDELEVRRVVAANEYVFHLAAKASIPYSFACPRESHEINVLGTINVLTAAARLKNIKRVVFSSSCSVYGDKTGLGGECKEDGHTNPLSPYALQKLTGEGYTRLLSIKEAMPAVSLRYFNVYGPGQPADSPYSGVVAKFCQAFATGQKPVIYGDGTQSRDFVYVEDVVRANLLASVSDKVGQGEVINIGCGHNHTLLKLVDILNDITNQKVKPTFEAPRHGEVQHAKAVIQRAKELLGWSPATDLYSGLAITLNEARRH